MEQYHLGAVPVGNIYKEYDFFAYFYNKYWMASSPKYFREALELLLYKYLKKGDNILDLCCGTGHMAYYFESDGYNVCGIDGSKAMLDYAKNNAKKSKFFQMDARDFVLDSNFKAVTCLFDSINHMLCEEDLLKVFKNVYNHLEDDGIFLFDVNSYESCQEVSLGDITAVEEENVFISKGIFDEKENMISYNLTTFIKEEDKWIRQDSCVYEKYYNEKIITSLLKKAGFSSINIIFGIDIEIEALEDRIFFTVWK